MTAGIPAGLVAVILTVGSGGASAWFVSFLARKKERATTENIEVTTESTAVATANALIATGLTVHQAAMVILQQENQQLKAELAALKATQPPAAAPVPAT